MDKTKLASTLTEHPGRIVCEGVQTPPESVLSALSSVRMWQGQRLRVRPLSGGLNNENWLVEDSSGEKSFLKVPGVGTGYIDRTEGNRGARRAAKLGIGAAVYEFDDERGYEVTEFLDGYETCTTTSLRTKEQGIQAMGIYRRLHGSERFGWTNTLFDQVDEHLRQADDLHVELPGWVHGLIGEYRDVKARFETSGMEIAPCHNDPMPGNFMVRGADMRMVDFEFCGDNEVSCELGLFLTEMFVEDEDVPPLLEEHFGRVTPERLARVQASRVVGDLKWGLWGVINSVVRDVAFDYWKYGMWKLMRAEQYRKHLDWESVKNGI